MSAKLYILDKQSLIEKNVYNLSFDNVKALFVDHFKGAILQDNSNLPFSINISDNTAVKIKPTDFMITIREKVDSTARGPNDQYIQKSNIDLGEINNRSKPDTPWELPDGFTELRRP